MSGIFFQEPLHYTAFSNVGNVVEKLVNDFPKTAFLPCFIA